MPPDAILVVDKPRGPTSRQVVLSVRRLTGAGKAGHAGTLDPISTGVLVVCLGRGTLLSGYLAGGGKEYLVSALIGVTTDTYDTEGEITARGDTAGLSAEEIEVSFDSFLGPILQRPPAYSAVKHKGKPLYRYARSGIDVEPEPRLVEVKSIELISFVREEGKLRVGLEVACGPGTYIRSLVHEIGEGLGCGACVEELRRTRSGDFGVEGAPTLDCLSSAGAEEIAGLTTTLEDATGSFPTVVVTDEGALCVGAGKPLVTGWISEGDGEACGTFRVLDRRGRLLALYGPPRDGDGEDISGRAVRIIRPVTLDCEANGAT
ncbi:MAG: tRNA pseudouridine(55) synthase TruB [Actinobacteria bacterium]|nr:tRNA pseudouridine(55) synthase TruB [Actinomycetota bacterium]